jgi:hypothetical protein
VIVTGTNGTELAGELMAVTKHSLLLKHGVNERTTFNWPEVKRIKVIPVTDPVLWGIGGAVLGGWLGFLAGSGASEQHAGAGLLGIVIGGGLFYGGASLLSRSREYEWTDVDLATKEKIKAKLNAIAHFPDADVETFELAGGTYPAKPETERTPEIVVATEAATSITRSDVDMDIPVAASIRPDAVAVVIGNSRYLRANVPPVDYAVNDARLVKDYLGKMFGYREGNIIYVENATQADFNGIFGTRENFKGRLYNYIKESKSDIFIYYSGHGAPNAESREGYFVPVDCDPSLVSLNGYSLNTFYNNLSKLKCKSLTVVIDACFSGLSEKGMLLKDVSPIFIQIDLPILKLENATVLTSAATNQVSSWYPEKGHSLFTYYLLKGVRGEADKNGDKLLFLSELKEYLDENVGYTARRLSNREQTPQVYGDLYRQFMTQP